MNELLLTMLENRPHTTFAAISALIPNARAKAAIHFSIFYADLWQLVGRDLANISFLGFYPSEKDDSESTFHFAIQKDRGSFFDVATVSISADDLAMQEEVYRMQEQGKFLAIIAEQARHELKAAEQAYEAWLNHTGSKPPYRTNNDV